MKFKLFNVVIASLILSFSNYASSTPMISTDIEGIGGDSYVFQFTLTNSGPDYAFSGFDILFSDSLFNGVLIDASPVGWVGDALTPFPPSDPFFHAAWGHGPDIFTLSDIVLPTGGLMDGFGAIVHYIGSSPISEVSLGFSFFDPFFTPKFEGDGSVSVSSFTPFVETPNPPDVDVPEPQTIYLICLALVGLFFNRCKSKNSLQNIIA